MIAAFKSFKHKILCQNFQDAFRKMNSLLTASDYSVVQLFSFG